MLSQPAERQCLKQRHRSSRRMGPTCFCSFVTCLLVSLVTRSHGAVTCPAACTCETRSVQCQQSKEIGSVPENLPSNDTLTYLAITNASLTQIREHDFKNYRGLQNLDLSDNQITEVADFTFTKMTALESLTLRNNFLRTLMGWELIGLHGLKVLDLSWNRLVELPQHCFRMLIDVEHIDLSGNDIELIQENVFVALDELKVLNLAGNTIIAVSENTFSHLGSLEHLILDDNAITLIEAGSFSPMKHLKHLSLNQNKELKSLSSEAFVSGSDQPPLEKLALNGTGLTEVPVKVLKYLKQLKVLDLSHTCISIIGRLSFNHLENLLSLTLDSLPSLSTIGTDAFRGLNSLIRLSITNNRLLKNISVAGLKGLKRLKVLDLHSNGLESVPEDLASWQELDVVDLRNNSLHCDCDAAWMLSLLREHRNVTASSRDLDITALPNFCNNVSVTDTKADSNMNSVSLARQIVCQAPPRLKGVCLASLKAQDFECHTINTHERLTMGLVAVVITCAVLLTVALFLKYRRRLCSRLQGQYRYSAHKNCMQMRQSSLTEAVEL